MDPLNEKEASATHHVSDLDDDLKKGPAVKEANVASVALTAAVNAQKPSLWSRNMIKLYYIMGIGYLVSTMNGFDRYGSWLHASRTLLTYCDQFPHGLDQCHDQVRKHPQAIPRKLPKLTRDSYQKSFGLDGAGSTTGIIFIIYNLGQIAAFPFCGFLADGYGRRWCIFVGCLLVLLGTAIQTSAHGMGQFISGRFILGFGASIASAAGPAYTVELAHPAYRGTMAGM